MNSKKALVGIVAGFAAGVVLGVLFAPEKGARTRKGIVRKGEDLADAFRDNVDERLYDLVDSVSRHFRKATHRPDTEKVHADANPLK